MATMRALIIANGDIPRKNILQPVLRSCDYVVCADGGARHARRLGVRPDVILGDLDSLSGASRRFFTGPPGKGRRAGVPILPMADQESTDLEKAISHCIRRGFREAVVAGATGDRADHSSLALGCFRKFGKRIDLKIFDRAGTVTMLKKNARIRMEPGERFSLIPLGRCTGVTVENALYALAGDALELGVREGVSNVSCGRRVGIRHRTGILLLYRFHAPDGTAGPGRRTRRQAG